MVPGRSSRRCTRLEEKGWLAASWGESENNRRAKYYRLTAASAWIGEFGAIALLLACVGLYGVVAQGVLQRTRELAVRSALGATPPGILVTVLGEGIRVAAIGGVAGALGALAALRVLRSLFTGVQAVDVRAATVAVALLAIALLIATYLPARRAERLDPMDTLRWE